MQLDKQSAREMVEAILWWEDQCYRLWNGTLGKLLGKVEREPVPDLTTENNSEK